MRCVSRRHAVADEMVQLARDVQLHAVRQVAAVGQVEPQHGVARLQRGQIDGHVGLAAGVGLDVGVLGAEELLGPIAGQVLDHVDVLAAAVVAPAGIALGVFVGQHAADGLHDGRAGVVFAGDHFQAVLLALDFGAHGGPDFGVFFGDEVHGGSSGLGIGKNESRERISHSQPCR